MTAVRVIDWADTLCAQKSANVGAERYAIIQDVHVIGVIEPAGVAVHFLAEIQIGTCHRVQAGMNRAGLLKVVVHIDLRCQRRGEVWQGEEAEQRLAHRIDPRRRNHVIRKLRIAVGRIQNLDLSAIVVEALREIAVTLQRRGRVNG